MGVANAFSEMCKKYWWENMLFINNLYQGTLGKMCLGHLWYLANDMQFFILTPPILFFYCRRRWASYLALGLLTIASVITVAVLTHKYNLPSGGMVGTNLDIYSDKIYIKPWGRILPYIMGIVLGIMYFEFKNQSKYPELQGRISCSIFQIL